MIVHPLESQPGAPAVQVVLHVTVPFDTVTQGGPCVMPSGVNIKGRKTYFGTHIGILLSALFILFAFLADFFVSFAFFIFLMPFAYVPDPLFAPV